MDKRCGTAEQFWAKVEKTETCWLWTGDKDSKGYGRVRRRALAARTVSAHRYSWLISSGEIPVGMCVLHRCDNPRCVRPSHLFLGTHQDNVTDMWKKGRGNPGRPCGEIQGSSKLTAEKVRKIRELAESGMTQKKIAQLFSIDRSNVSLIVLRKGWAHV